MWQEKMKDMWDATEGGEPPADFVSLASSYMRHKCVYGAQDFTESDFAVCVLNYKLYKSSSKKASANG